MTKPLLIPRFLHGVSAGSQSAQCRQGAGPLCGSSENEAELRKEAALKFEEEKSLELGIDYPTFIWIYQQQLLGSLWAPHIPLSLAALKKHLQGPTQQT